MKNILILGGGFGGIKAALELHKKVGRHGDVKITLIDRENYQTFTPLLYEIASAYGITHHDPYHTKLRGTVSIPYGHIFKNKKVNLIQAEISKIDIQNHKVSTRGEEVFDFDYLVIALGSEVSTFGIPGVSEYAYKFKTTNHALMIYDKVEEIYEEGGKGVRELPIKFVIGGAGFAGIEIAAELAMCTAHASHKHKVIWPACTSIVLAEAGPKILPMVSDNERKTIETRLKNLGVLLMENTAIEEVGPDWVKFKSGDRLNTDMTVWTAGVQATELITSSPELELNSRQRILVNEFLQANRHNNVFAIGDNIEFIDPANNKPIPQMAYLAADQARVVADNIVRLMAGEQNLDNRNTVLKRYKPYYDLWVAPVGRKYAFAHIGKFKLKGLMGYLAREVVDLKYYLSILPLFDALRLFKKEVEILVRN
ncbi:MAG: NAD(P)/FAD-dependent oxidoreductase [bacterium]|nr:NAD(P)/FAD-dependent oxidoreductase [bacterium]